MVRIWSAGALFCGALLLAATLAHSAEQPGNTDWKPIRRCHRHQRPARLLDALARAEPTRLRQGRQSSAQMERIGELAWKTKLPGGGNSTPIVYGDRLFLTASTPRAVNATSCASARRTAKSSGRRLPSRTRPRRRATNGTATRRRRAPPTANASSPSSARRACTAMTWTARLWHESFGVFTSEAGWGVGASPIIYENLVIINCDNDGPNGLPKAAKDVEAAPMNLVALDKTNGKVVWKTPRNQGRGFQHAAPDAPSPAADSIWY